MNLLSSHIANASGRLESHREVINTAFDFSSRAALELLQAERIDVLFIDSADETIPEMGVGGYTYGPHVIIIAIDPQSPNFTEAHLATTLVHEFHHAMRWRGPGCGKDLGGMLVSEGLAQLFEEEVLGVAPMYSQASITALEIDQAKSELFRQPFSQSKWFFGAEGMTRNFGYTFGYEICKSYAESKGKRASELVGIETSDLLVDRGLT
ncbi:hypothetical protein GALL_365220 [mine drainage metagenome]|uniref:DUF2268 domain-containing protein n=1 Tax=mine drainage metagenome TaxID=410659 RepID=A0A1J5R0L8_9ZZZZ